MDPAVIAIGAGGFITAAIALYRARADKTAVETGTTAGLMEAAVATAKGLAEASAMVVEPLRQELASARERLAKVELHAKNCDEKLDSLHIEFADLKATVVNGTEAHAEARTEVAAQVKERARVQERDRKADEKA